MGTEAGIPLMHQLIDPLSKELAGSLLELPYHHSLYIHDQSYGPLMLISPSTQQNCETFQDLHTITKRKCLECSLGRGVTVLHNNACFHVAPTVPEYAAPHALEGDGHAS
jgi:hypothetical protein